MSIESAKAFYERIVTDKTFRTQYQNVVTSEERREVILAAGYRFTPEEWEAATTQIQASSSTDGELSNAQLEAVSGGYGQAGAQFAFPTVGAAYGMPPTTAELEEKLTTPPIDPSTLGL